METEVRGTKMTLTSRPYAGMDDFQQIRDLLIENKGAAPYSGFHLGDLNWDLFCDTSDSRIPNTEKGRIWEKDGRVVAYGWAHLDDSEYDLVVHHTLQGTSNETEMADAMITWMTEVALSKPQQPDSPRMVASFAYRDQTSRIVHLESKGFTGSDYVVVLAQQLPEVLPLPTLSGGFQFLDAMTLAHADERAAAHFDAFSPKSRMRSEHYRPFMQAPDYDPTLDIVTLAPDGRIAAFAMGWLDEANQLGTYEPVGTRHEFHRQGLGKATLLEGLRRFKARGAKTVTVMTGAEQPDNIAFYQSVGFELVNTVRFYEKKLD